MIDALVGEAIENANRLATKPHNKGTVVPIGCKTISRSRFDAVQREMTSAARKVYEATPIAELWTAHKIMAELKRTGVQMPINAVSGCIDGLIHSGVVQEPIRGNFRRAEIKEPAAKAPEPTIDELQSEIMRKPDPKPVPAAVVDKKSALDLLGELSSRASVLADMLRKLSVDMENAAIDIQQQIESNQDETGKLKQLQALLKSLA